VTDPRQVLGIAANATQEEIRAAYLRRIKEHPPDSSPEEFERVRDAYETLRDPRRRAQALLFAVDPEAPLTSLIADRRKEHRFLGPSPWLAALKRTMTRE
jgi:curved DNA-binding protein CbpA